MAADAPELTLFMGPNSAHGLAINKVVKAIRKDLATTGLRLVPTRWASPMMRTIVSAKRDLAERRASFRALTEDGPAFYCALNFLGTPHSGERRADLFVEAEDKFDGLAAASDGAPFRVVLALQPLPHFFCASASDVLDTRVKATPWEQLYAMSWAELVMGLVDACPNAEVLVLRHESVAQWSEEIFGDAASADVRHALFRALLTTTGQAVVDRMPEQPSDEAARELYASFAELPDALSIRERLGLDRLTAKLLAQRFEEDMAAIAMLDGVRVI